MKYLLFISLFFCVTAACSSSKEIASSEKAVIPFWTPELMDSIKRNDFRITFSTPKANITGIYIAKRMNEEWRGSIINEFGLKVLDFVSTPKKCRLVNVVTFLDKWYIKKEVASDIQFIMEVDNPRYNIGIQTSRYWRQDTLVVKYKTEKELQRFPDGEIKYINHKRGLTYLFKKIYETER
jgi:hypothetical protein